MKKLFFIITCLCLFLVSISDVNAYTIRIGLQTKVATAGVGASSEAVIFEEKTLTPLVKINKMERYIAFARANTDSL